VFRNRAQNQPAHIKKKFKAFFVGMRLKAKFATLAQTRTFLDDKRPER
jgi:hypothetical protein